MKEWLLPFNDNVPNYRDGRERGSLNFYIYLLQIYLTESLKFSEGSKAENYKNRALELIDKVLYKEHDLEDIDDIFLIFTGSLRFHKDDLRRVKKIYLNESIDMTLYRDDESLLAKISNDYESAPDAIIPKPNLMRPKNLYYEERRVVKKFLFLNNTIFLTRGLQKQGYFS